MKTIRDTIHGDITLTGEEMRVVDTPEFQRLRGIRQLGTSNLVFPGAQHTRFEHSLGTCWVAKRMIDRINGRASRAGLHEPIDGETVRFLSLAALLHDITHIPFGHTFEDERRILPAHDKSGERLRHFLFNGRLAGVLKELKVAERLFDFFTRGKQQAPAFAWQLVAGPICADLLDYLKRDAHYCGLNLGYDDRIFHYLNVEAGQLCFDLYSDRGFRQDAWSELINLLRMRYHLTERVYYHHTKMVSGAMLSRILEALLAVDGIAVAELYRLRDDGFLNLLEQRIGRIPSYRPLLEAYGARHGLEKKLARHLGIPASAVVIYAPDIHMQLKEAHVMVRVNPGPLVSLASLKQPELEALSGRHQALWKFFLFMDPAHEDKFLRAGRFLTQEIGLPNQLELFNKGQMTLNF